VQAEVHGVNGLIREMGPMQSRADNGGRNVELALPPGEKIALVDAALFEAAPLNVLVDAMPSAVPSRSSRTQSMATRR
jgi:hypothetical protein